ncbi:hypothetical protein [Candidatus Clostridium helianthi]|uniref:GtrA-like protein domain-containing protein n=1 Tax=Candidatus Clostridium helianthi TaxID=3381660 RepID=A0ABW8S203_9CLOT
MSLGFFIEDCISLSAILSLFIDVILWGGVNNPFPEVSLASCYIFLTQIVIIYYFGGNVERIFWGVKDDENFIASKVKNRYIISMFTNCITSLFLLYLQIYVLGTKKFFILGGLFVGQWIWACMVFYLLIDYQKRKDNETEK